MNMRQRVMRYLLGLGIGCAMVFFMFPNYNWLGWTPNNTLMRQIREGKFAVSERGRCYLDCTMTGMEQVQAIRNGGKVDFGQSDAKANPKKYRVVYGEMGVDLLMTDTLVTLDVIHSRGSELCICP